MPWLQPINEPIKGGNQNSIPLDSDGSNVGQVTSYKWSYGALMAENTWVTGVKFHLTYRGPITPFIN